MPNYFYIAKSFQGDSETGVLYAKDEFQLAQLLKGRGLVLIKAGLEGKKEKSLSNLSLPFAGVSAAEKIMMVRNLGVMFSTGLALVKSFEILSRQTKNQKLRDALADIKDRINKGEKLSDALARYPKIFSEFFISMVRVGEESGTLEEIFQILAFQLTKEHDLRSKIRNAMIYPGVIMLAMGAVGIVLITFVLPSLNVFFVSLNVDIPIYTRLMLSAGSFLSVHWYLLVAIPLALVAGFWGMQKTKKGKWIIDTAVLRLPIISPIVKKNNAAFLVRSLSSLIASGVAVTRSLEITAGTLSNSYFKAAGLEAAEKIKKGEKLSAAFKAHEHIFPYGVVQIIEVGEETGKTADILKKLADFYEQEAVSAVEKLSVLIEPMLIIVLGLSVGFFAFSIIQPMYSSFSTIQ